MHMSLMRSDNVATSVLSRESALSPPEILSAMNKAAMAFGLTGPRITEPSGRDERNLTTATDLTAMQRTAAAQALAGGIAGLAGGLFGVGGGLVLVPILAGSFKLTQHQAHGTSLAIIGATALISVVVYALNGNVAWLTAAPVGVASGFAARWGARLAARTSAEGLAKAFAVFLLAVAIRLLWKTPAAAGHPFPGGVTVAVDLAVGVAVGLLAGYMGGGGGLIAVPAFTL